jgi:tetratricopeptide (TPR) repeat protein
MTEKFETKIQSLFKKKDFKNIIGFYQDNSKNFEDNLILLESLCLSFFNLGNKKKSKEIAEKIILIKADHLGAHHIIARSLLDENIDDAMKSYEDLIKLSNNSTSYIQEYANLLFSLGIYTKTAKLINKLVSKNPDVISFKVNLAKTYIQNSDFDNAITLLKNIFEIEKNPLKKNEFLNLLGTAYHNKGDYDLAKECYQKCIKFDDRNVQAYINFAILEQEYGFFDKAQELLNQANKIKKNAESYRIISLGKKFKTKEDLDIIEMHALESSASLPDADRSSLFFALGKAYEDIKEYSLSGRYYVEGNKLRREFFKNYNFQKEIDFFKEMQKIYNINFFKTLTNISNLGEGLIFIVGMPRSGTTLLEQIISSHKEVIGAGELNYFSESIDEVYQLYDFENFKKEIAQMDTKKIAQLGNLYTDKIFKKKQSLNSLSREKYIIDKNPINFKLIPLIYASLPKSKIIHIKRNRNDNCFSIYKNFFYQNVMPWSYSQTELKKYYECYNEYMENISTSIKNFVHETEYEKITSNLENEIKKILNFLNLDWDDNCMNFYTNKKSVRTASLNQVRQKIYQTSKNKWEIYKPYINDLFV